MIRTAIRFLAILAGLYIAAHVGFYVGLILGLVVLWLVLKD